MKKFIFTFYTSDFFGGYASIATLKANDYSDLLEEAYKRGLSVYGIKRVDKNIKGNKNSSKRV